MLRVGTVSSINAAAGSARVAFTDRDNLVSYELPVMKFAWPVQPGEDVVCIFLPTGAADGFVLGAYHTEDDPPAGGV
jgi:phage baseplate assembly protein gpV